MKTSPATSAFMRNSRVASGNTEKAQGISLQRLINQLLGQSMTTAFHNKSLVINEISKSIELSKDRALVAPVIRDLLKTVIANAFNGDICISAERFRDTIILNIQDRNNNNGYALAYSVRGMEAEAARVGASIDIDGEQKRVITISLSFSNSSGTACYDC